MSLTEHFMDADDSHPIDVVETLAEHHAWEFDRVGDDQIALAVDGQWRTYAITAAWSDYEETLRLVCSFEMEPPKSSMAALYECLNLTNDQLWTGSFSYWAEQKLMVYRYGLIVPQGHTVGLDQINRMVGAAVTEAERFYPAFQLVSHGGQSPAQALKVAIAEAYGHA